MANFNLTSATNLFKIKYGKLSQETYNSANVLLGRVKKEYAFTGKRMDVAVPTSFSGGVGSGVLPTANSAAYQDAQITAKKSYSVIEIEREAIKASENDEGAFVRMTKEAVRKGVESFNRNTSRMLFNDGTGALGTIQANATGTAAAPVIIISAATFKEANWEEKDYVNCGTDSSVFEVVSVVASTRTITLSRISGSLDLTATGSGLIVYMQNSKDKDISGLKGVLDATTGSLYGVTVGRRWQAYQKAAGGVGLTTDAMNEVMLGVERQCGKVPNLIITSYVQYRKLLNQLEDQKQYIVEPRSPELKGKVSFRGVEFMSNAGPVGVFVDRFVEDDRMYFLNDNYMTIHHRPGAPDWASDDGTVFLRKASADDYEARYVSYSEFYCPPSFHGVATGFAV
tara:strand:- start:1877 stop:3070 length:1194 start_codon:yes stop_codon:yes gene_type:complete